MYCRRYCCRLSVVLHSWSIKEEIEDKKFDYIAIMRPTSPIRPDNIIEKGIEILNKNPSLSSVRAMRKLKNIRLEFGRWYGNFVEPLMNNVFEPGNIPRQKLSKKYYYQSGELEIVKRSTLQLGSVSGPKVGIIEIDETNVDIDSEDDSNISYLWFSHEVFLMD